MDRELLTTSAFAGLFHWANSLGYAGPNACQKYLKPDLLQIGLHVLLRMAAGLQADARNRVRSSKLSDFLADTFEFGRIIVGL
jgi:hypothetical protein